MNSNEGYEYMTNGDYSDMPDEEFFAGGEAKESTVRELNSAELSQLKQTYVCMLCEDPSYGELADADEIPDEVIFEAFDGIVFTPEDFWCNCH